MKADLASMAHSLELRSPFLDHEVLELGLSLPDRLRSKGHEARSRCGGRSRPICPRGSPAAARRASASRSAAGSARTCASSSADLLLDRRARERGQFRPAEVKRLLDEHGSGSADHGHRLWCLLMLELWQRFYVESEVPPASALDTRVDSLAAR